MSEAADLKARHQQVLAIAERTLDVATLAIIKSALEADHRMAVIRDAFIEGRDHEAVHLIRELDPIGPRALLPTSTTWQVIEPGQTAQITARPQLPFMPTHLLVSQRCRDFMINDIRVANASHFVQAGDVPADLFVVDAPELDALTTTVPGPALDPVIELKVNTKAGRLGIALDLPIVKVGWDVTIIVTNAGHTPEPFRGCWLGQVKWVEPPGPTYPRRQSIVAGNAALADAHEGTAAVDQPGPPPETPPGEPEP